MQNARAAIRALDRRTRLLEDELRQRYAQVLEQGSVIAGLRKGIKPQRSAASEELYTLFDVIARRVAERESLVTVVIPVYGKIEYTLRCLRSIAVTWSDQINPTIVVVDDASPDGSAHELLGLPIVDLVQNGRNLGYLRSTNRGASLASTKYVCFLNNDTEVAPGWLDWLVSAAEADPLIGIVGSKLIYPDGTLQEAGSIIWSDGTGWNYGRGDDPRNPKYNVRRDVDYCSAASMLIRTGLLRKIGGFDERFAPAYYEDADICFEARAHGFRTIYEPGSELVHYEGVSSGTDLSSGAKRFQEINRPKFAEKWESVLSTQHFAPSAANVEAAAARTVPKSCVLIIDSYVPMHDREAGSNRLFKIIGILRDLQYHVIFLPDNFASVEPYTSDLVRLGVEVLYRRTHGPGRDDMLRAVLARCALAWICRPELCSYYLPIVRARTQIPVVYDTIDLHFSRERKRAELEGGDDSVWRSLMELELATARASDLVVTVTDIERDVLRGFGIQNVSVIPTVHDLEVHRGLPYGVRSGIVFIGGYGHTPNADAALWLCLEIMPLVWQHLPNLHVTLLGNQPTEEVIALGSKRVTVTGYVADVRSFFEEARLFVAPLRYGAGMKGKVGQALSFGLPVVTTPVGADGYNLLDGRDCLIAADAETFAAKVITLYQDEELWNRLSSAGEGVVAKLGSSAVAERLGELLKALGLPRPESV